ncbi:inactive protein RESTRICTED TEV MOVEMENT 2-like isoform X2 [Hibiscus syriacus]|uniref:inactive protein RESTRICTED TEV MOVEMENT 2-like isoform X2 n=1 Tax=Hibiscus syriacus TaxID=106335 RepID=UPI001923AC5D|nr:inactive protein RESTRICTED TEV MOVEMENT 2-like isoform X2 [Hibiscus syriacus]
MAGRARTNAPAVVYKDFQPRVDRKEEQGADVLVIHLPDFRKEQVNVKYVDSKRTIEVQAEKAADRKTRSRMNQSFPVPENCIVEKIQGSYRNGLLTITMPKRTFTQLDSPKDADANVPKPITPPKPTSSAAPAVAKQREQKPKSTPEPIAPQPKPPAETVAKPIAEPAKPPMAMAPQTPKEKAKGKEVEALPSLKQQEEIQRKVSPPAKQTVEEKAKGKEIEALPSLKQQEEIQRKVSPTAKQTGEEKADGSMVATPEVVEKKGETKDGLKDLVKEKAKDSTPKATTDMLKPSEKGGAVEKKPKEGGGGFMEMRGMDTIMKTVKRLATDDAEDRQLLINIGVSVLVIAALGAYITYSYRSSGKAKN